MTQRSNSDPLGVGNYISVDLIDMGVGFGPLFLYKIMQSNMLIEFWELFLEMLCECQYLVEGFNFSFCDCIFVHLYLELS